MNDQTPLNLSRALLSIPSVAGNHDQMALALSTLEKFLSQDSNITIERFVSNGHPSFLAYRGPQRPDLFDVLLNAHVDVVHGKPSQFKPKVRNGRLYGRGASDMKVAAAVMACVFRQLAPGSAAKIGFQVVTDEETNGHNGTLYQIDQGVRAKFVLAGEDTPASTICTEMCGVCLLEVSFEGKAAHSGYVWRGSNALLKATSFIDKLIQDYPLPNTDVWRSTVNISDITTRRHPYNVIPDQATIFMDFRYIAADQNFASHEAVRSFITNLDPHAKVAVKQLEPAHITSPDNVLLQTLASSVKQATGQAPNFIKRHGTSDVRFYGARRIPAVTLGLPDHNTHGDHEFVAIEDIETYKRILEAFLTKISIPSVAPAGANALV